MKTILLNYPGRFSSGVPRLGAVTVVALLLAAGNLAGATLPAASTFSGGRAGTPRYGYVDGDTAAVAQFHTPIGLALDNSRGRLYVADRDNNAIRKLDLDLNQTITFATNGINRIRQPVGVALDGAGNLYALNRGNGSDGTVLKIDTFGNFLGTNASGLANANGIALDGGGNIFVTVNNNSIIRIPRSGPITTLATIPDASAILQGITVRDDSFLAVCDSGRHVILLVDPATGSATRLTGLLNTPGDQFGTSDFAQFNQPRGLANAGDGSLVVMDYGNNRVKKVDPSGTVCNLYGVCSNNWVTGSGTYPGWFDGNGCLCETTCEIC